MARRSAGILLYRHGARELTRLAGRPEPAGPAELERPEPAGPAELERPEPAELERPEPAGPAGPAERAEPAELEVLLAHMGGPMWARRERAWTVPKGEYGPDEDPQDAARREFAEEMGASVPDVPLHNLGEVHQSGGKTVTVWAGESDFDAGSVVSNTVQIEWPPRSGHRITIPEIDRAAWFGPDEAKRVLVAAQAEFVDRLIRVCLNK